MSVTVVIPAVEWDDRLRRTLDSVRAQALSGGSIEVLVASPSPPSSDWVEVAGERWIENSTGAIPVGLNRALAEAEGDVVVRVDSRCLLPAGYVAAMVDRLYDPSVGMVGGAALVIDPGWWGDLYGTVFNSPLLGPSRYRYSQKSGPASTAYLGAWRRDDLVAWGGFDERLLRNQDNEIASRVASQGLAVWYEADAVVGYEAAKPLLATIRHHYGFGRWRMRQRSMGQQSMSTAQRGVVVGALLVLVLGSASLTSRRTRGATMALGVVGYGATAATASMSARRLRDRRSDLGLRAPSLASTVMAPALAVLLDGAWALGLLVGRLRESDDAETVS